MSSRLIYETSDTSDNGASKEDCIEDQKERTTPWERSSEGAREFVRQYGPEVKELIDVAQNKIDGLQARRRQLEEEIKRLEKEVGELKRSKQDLLDERQKIIDELLNPDQEVMRSCISEEELVLWSEDELVKNPIDYEY